MHALAKEIWLGKLGLTPLLAWAGFALQSFVAQSTNHKQTVTSFRLFVCSAVVDRALPQDLFPALQFSNWSGGRGAAI